VPVVFAATDPSETIGEIPHLADFTFHRTLPDIDFDEIPVTGLDADFYRRPVGDRTLSVGVYRFGGAETHRAWGWVGEPHCSWHAYRDPATGAFDGPFQGCPRMRLLLDGDRARGFELGSGRLARRYFTGSSLLGQDRPLADALQPGRPAGVDDRGDRDREPEEQPAAGEQRRGPR
jgi:hypothetical protein